MEFESEKVAAKILSASSATLITDTGRSCTSDDFFGIEYNATVPAQVKTNENKISLGTKSIH